MFCVNGQCGSGTQELYTSDAGDIEGKNDLTIRNYTDIDGDGIADIATRGPSLKPSEWTTIPALSDAPDAPELGASAPSIKAATIKSIKAATIAASTKAGSVIGWTPVGEAGPDNTPCAGQVGLTGYNTQYVDCPTSRTVTETMKVPRTVVTNREETRTRTRYVPKTVSTPVTKYRTETRMVPQQRTVPYTDIQYNTVNEPVTEKYTVNIPETKTYTDTKYRTRYVSGTKRCPVKVPVYGASCGATAPADA